MATQLPQPLRGFRDFLPEEARKRQWLKARMIEVFESWGYEPLETPTLEPLELFVGEIGEDEKLFFKFEDQGGRKVALRYDQTVPTCRVVGYYEQQLTFPFRRYQIQSAFRAERPQKGRYREFTQSDIDIFGVASPIADAEIIAATLDLYRQLGFKQAVALINSRDLMKDIPYEAIVAIDKLKKIGVEGVIEDMVKKGIDRGKANEYYNAVKSLKPDQTLETIFSYLKTSGIPDDWYRFEPTLARSFSYSEGPIWEIVIPEYGDSSVGGGERYDGLMKRLTGKTIPATGIGIGFDRTLEALEALNLIPDLESGAKVLITVFDSNLFKESLVLGAKLRAAEIPVEVYPDNSAKLDKQLKYANRKNFPAVVILGPDEKANKQITVKNMQSGEQETVSQDLLVSTVSKMLQ